MVGNSSKGNPVVCSQSLEHMVHTCVLRRARACVYVCAHAHTKSYGLRGKAANVWCLMALGRVVMSVMGDPCHRAAKSGKTPRSKAARLAAGPRAELPMDLSRSLSAFSWGKNFSVSSGVCVAVKYVQYYTTDLSLQGTEGTQCQQSISACRGRHLPQGHS